MSTHQTELEADLAAAQRLGASRLAVTTEKAIAALALVEAGALQNAEHVTANAKAFGELAGVDLKDLASKGREVLHKHLTALTTAEEKFWEAFHGQVVRGIELVRRRSPAAAPSDQPAKAAAEVKS